MTEIRIQTQGATRAVRPVPIRADVEIEAPPAAVWAEVSDVRAMASYSPELRRVLVLGRRATGTGVWFVGVNRRGLAVWPTSSTIVRWEPERAVAWKTRESGATWLYELTPRGIGTTLTGSRILPRFSFGTTLLGPVIGGAAGHDAELTEGLATTLQRIRQRLER